MSAEHWYTKYMAGTERRPSVGVWNGRHQKEDFSLTQKSIYPSCETAHPLKSRGGQEGGTTWRGRQSITEPKHGNRRVHVHTHGWMQQLTRPLCGERKPEDPEWRLDRCWQEENAQSPEPHSGQTSLTKHRYRFLISLYILTMNRSKSKTTNVF